ncbi:Type 1 glutamine amidotransferase-like domain-containing protein [Anabaenopsis tanganyikae CS-531]|uniref:Type 1 glutamine amidotransferase-like domain-containing protein n=3 Tax=Nodulariaceae TaxID=3079761 RepID=A0ABT6KET6_9CYAN|nr:MULTISPECIES: Type 1 glutamine amidotransferase-like domain-containing protein [Anabaenopsis]MDB9541502.1 Type 1 glutamine amidotransferase-like domain-containing protein [Anabaenopsis arnoldii]MDH6090481.1 Type 1 glutamine amidotransferase-like domain-containing protein [Anabaenopsis arnoldii]MDH6106392.1 Type 1 glutamine amidotransferase-like domain-containing protein [Anabaenopsis tanganyikae CS-531]
MTKVFPSIAKWFRTIRTMLRKMGTALIAFLNPDIPPEKTLDLRPPSVTPLAGPVHILGGGGPDVEEAIQWMIHQVRGSTSYSTKVNVVVLRTSGSDDYNRLIYNMQGVKYVETLVISNRQDANKSEIIEKVKNADVIFFAGGDQCEYIRNWKNTKLEATIKSVYAKGGGIGGTSAGAMIQSDYVYDACASSQEGIETREALEDPYRDITFTYNFFPWSHLTGTIVDTHFDRRKRMGRIMAFIARQIQDGVSKSVLGIAISEETSVTVDKFGMAKVMGRGAAYFVLGDHPPEICKPRTPLTYYDYKIWRVPYGDTFNLRNLPTRGYYLRSVKRGRFDSDPY